MLSNRNFAIDFLRGIAIIGMVMAALIPWTNDFPAWMYHAQVGPPDFRFNPQSPGITWVDLVFPFFLFSMGAAFPLALRSKLDRGENKVIWLGLLRRGILLVFFAIALAYLTPDNLHASPIINYLTALVAFGSFFLIFMRFEGTLIWRYGLQFLGFLIIGLLVFYHSEILGNTFNKSKSNIIILVLANMAVFGSACWLITANNQLLRIAIILAFIGVWFSHSIEGSWTSIVWDFHPKIKWFYNFSFFKYLCIVLPGSILGDLLLKHKHLVKQPYSKKEKPKTSILVMVSIAFVVFQVVTLYQRELNINLFGHVLFGFIFILYFRNVKEGQAFFYKKIIIWGYVLTSIALCFEPLDGGIKKDPSSFSYWFLTSGLAFIFYIVGDYCTRLFSNNIIVMSIVRNGQNPMLAYCVSAFFITPLFGLASILPLFDDLRALSPYLGLVKTAVYIFLIVLVTNYTTYKNWFWRS